MRGLFFTGTDTGVGKTFVLSTILKVLKAQGRNPRVSKPVATGAIGIADDTLQLAKAINLSSPSELQTITPWTFSEPAAPPVAARVERLTLTIEGLVSAVQTTGEGAEILLVEGVGGLLCPLTESHTVADLVRELGLPLIVVARRSLGTLNHTMLTVEAALQRKLNLAGVVVNETTPPLGLADETNVEELRRRLSVPILTVVPHGDDGRQAREAVARVDWWKLGLSSEEADVWSE